jgi:hypothetical protein
MPIRAEARDASEMVTQGLAGELVEWLEAGERDWVRVRCAWDGYEGWCDRKQISQSTDEQEYRWFCLTQNMTCFDRLDDGATLWLSMGCRLVVASEEDGSYRLGGWTLSKRGLLPSLVPDPVAAAESLLGVPYLWGGRSATGVDCSGLVQLVFGLTGIKLPRDASEQIAVGAVVDLGQEERGDLAFFANDQGAIVHVGILCSPVEILHAAGEVRRDTFSPAGIVHASSGVLTHALAGVRRVR